ncbi:MAG: thiamine pyrophosphate-dependent enzyme [Firmicutes bacterium]|nr:thiamine pyrophosphate-dependent enzyme [Bacillota bacterium]
MELVYKRPQSLTETHTHYCPGCTHGIIHRLVGEVIDELGVKEKTIAVFPVGCAAWSFDYFNVDSYQALHGRAPAVATGVKRVHPDKVVFTYQGDGDLAGIGAGEIVNAAARGERITTVFVNNAIYGATGGQMAPTTLVGQKTTTTPLGRDPARHGYPTNIVELLSTQQGVVYAARVCVMSPANVVKAKQAIKKAFEYQLKGLGFSIVEVLSACVTNWGVSPVEALTWVKEKMIPYYPLGVFKDVGEGAQGGA